MEQKINLRKIVEKCTIKSYANNSTGTISEIYFSAMHEAVRQALELAAENAVAYTEGTYGTPQVSKDSITDVIKLVK